MSQSLNLNTGRLGGTPVPDSYSGGREAANIYRELARIGPDQIPFDPDATYLSVPASLDLRFQDGMFYERDLSTGAEVTYPDFSLMRTITRTGAGWSPNWDFRSGSAVGALVEYAANEVRWNEPVGLPGSALIEATGASNLNQNARWEGATPGVLNAGGVLPTNMTITGLTTAEVEVISVTTEDGWPRLRLRLNGTPSADPLIIIEGITQVAGVDTNTFTHSIGVAMSAGDLTNITDINAKVVERTAAGAIVTSGSTTFTPDATHKRYTHPRTLAGGGTVAKVTGDLGVNWDGSGAIDVTLDLYVSQLETGLVASSPVLPVIGTPAASTRGAETVTDGLTFTRASRANYIDWDFTSGGIVRGMSEFQANCPRVGRRGLLVEDSSTNLITNPRCKGTDGSDAYLPSNWKGYNTGSFTTAKSNQTDHDGLPSVDIRWTQTAPALGSYVEHLFEDRYSVGDGSTNLDGTIFTGSVCVELVGGSLDNLSWVYIRVREFNAGGSSVGQTDLDISAEISSGKRRFIIQRTCASSGVYAGFSFAARADGGGDVDITLRVGAPQFEELAYPTSPILPEVGAPAASTRDKDVGRFIIGDWFSGPAFSFVCDFALTSCLTGYVLDFVSSSTERYSIRTVAGDVRSVTSATIAGGDDGYSTFTGYVAGERVSIASAFEEDNLTVSVNGGTQVVDSECDTPATPTFFTIGAALTTGTNHAHTFIELIRVMPGPGILTPAELETAVGN